MQTGTCLPFAQYESLLEPHKLEHAFVVDTLSSIDSQSLCSSPERLQSVVHGLAQTAIDPWNVVLDMASCSQTMARVMSADVGAVDSYRLHEHTQAMMSGLEADYITTLDDPGDRTLLRSTGLFHDIGKPLCVAHCQDRHMQSFYNRLARDNLLMSIPDDLLTGAQKITMRLLVDHDIIGTTVKRRLSLDAAASQLALLVQRCPTEYQSKFLGFQRAIYLSDVTAYTSYRSYREAETGNLVRCRRNLNRLFTVDTDSTVQFRHPKHRVIIDHLLGKRVHIE
jgi:hypothetical protein